MIGHMTIVVLLFIVNVYVHKVLKASTIPHVGQDGNHQFSKLI